MGPEERGDEFGEALSRLRATGSALLVAGAVPDRLHRRACSELSGTDSAARLFVRTGSGAGETVAPAPTDRVLELDVASRGTAAAGATAAGTTGSLAVDADGAATAIPTLSAAGAAFEDALAGLEGTAEGGPRVCVGSVLPLLETAGEERTFRFLHLVTSRVRRLGGTCHLHLPSDPDGAAALTVAALVDATVELRLADDRPEQRWRLHGEGVRSDWLPLDED